MSQPSSGGSQSSIGDLGFASLSTGNAFLQPPSSSRILRSSSLASSKSEGEGTTTVSQIQMQKKAMQSTKKMLVAESAVSISLIPPRDLMAVQKQISKRNLPVGNVSDALIQETWTTVASVKHRAQFLKRTEDKVITEFP